MTKLVWCTALLALALAGCGGAGVADADADADGEGWDEMGPPPYEYIRILGEAVPDWVPPHLRPADETGIGAMSWSPLGPRPIENEYWSGNDDASGRVPAIATHPTDPNIVYIGAASGGVWKTVDGGLNWTPLTDELSNLNHGAIAIDPSDPEVIYAGTGEYTTGSDGDGVFRSEDGGATWNRIATTGQVGKRISRFIVDPTDSMRLHVSGDFGYYRSLDRGQTWTDRFAGSASDLALNPDDPSVLYLGRRNQGVYRSTDGGATWTQLTNGLPADDVNRVLVAIAPSDPDRVFAVIINGSAGLRGLYRTDDGGDTWTEMVNTPDFPRPQGWYDAFIGVDPSHANVVYCGGVFPTYAEAGVIKSTNGGDNWVDITMGAQGGQLHPDQHTIAFGPDGTLWVGNDGGVWKSTNGGLRWINTNRTLTLTQNYNIAINPQAPEMVMGGTQDNGTVERREDVESWPQLVAGDGGFLAYDFENPNIKYSTYVSLSVQRFINGVFSNITGPWGGDPVNFIAPLVMDPNDPHTLLGGTNRVWRTHDAHAGANWAVISTSAVGGGGTLNAIAVGVGASDMIYTGSSTGKVYVTTNASTWINRSGGLPGAQISDIILDPADPERAYVGFHKTFGGRLYVTNNAGADWTNATGDLPVGVSARAVEVDWQSEPPTLFVGTGVGVYTSLDGGKSWIKDGDDLPNVNIGDFVIDRDRGMIYVGTYGRGVWKSPLPVTCTGDVDGSRSVDFQDLIDVLIAWGPCAGCPEDIDRDGVVGFADLLILLGAWGVCP